MFLFLPRSKFNSTAKIHVFLHHTNTLTIDCVCVCRREAGVERTFFYYFFFLTQNSTRKKTPNSEAVMWTSAHFIDRDEVPLTSLRSAAVLHLRIRTCPPLSPRGQHCRLPLGRYLSHYLSASPRCPASEAHCPAQFLPFNQHLYLAEAASRSIICSHHSPRRQILKA